MYNNLLLEIKNNSALIMVNRPDKLNALNSETIDEMKVLFNKLDKDDNIGCIIITGSGEKSFIAGADIAEINKLDVISAKSFSEKGQLVFQIIENLSKPVIAAVNGYALGGGCELALACHFRYASENAKFGQPEINLGILPGYGGTQRLARLINTGYANEMILTGNIIDANEALRIGLVNKVFPQNELLLRVEAIASQIASKSASAVSSILKAIKSTNEIPLKAGLEYEVSLFSLSLGTEDAKEGTSAFLEKRKPVFKNK